MIARRILAALARHVTDSFGFFVNRCSHCARLRAKQFLIPEESAGSSEENSSGPQFSKWFSKIVRLDNRKEQLHEIKMDFRRIHRLFLPLCFRRTSFLRRRHSSAQRTQRDKGPPLYGNLSTRLPVIKLSVHYTSSTS